MLLNVYVYMFGDSSLTFDNGKKTGAAKHLTPVNVTDGIEHILGGYLRDPLPEGTSLPAGPPFGAAGAQKAAHAECHGVLQHEPNVFRECGCPLRRLVMALREELRKYGALYRDSSGALIESAPEMFSPMLVF